MLRLILADPMAVRPSAEIARAFHAAVADLVVAIATRVDSAPVVVSGGVFQIALLMEMLAERLGDRRWFNRSVPPNDGGLSLGQAALA